MNKFTKQNGITLIALIITIIVMLILVAVTISVALNGGIFDRAKTASDKTQEQVEKEQLILAIVAANDALTGKINKGTLQNELNELIGDWQVTGEDGGPYGVTTPTGKVYTITKNGELAEGWIDNGDGTYTKGTETVTVGVTTYSKEQVQEKLGISEISYNDTWTVIGAEGDKLKLVSTKNVTSSLSLGFNDQIANGDETTPDYTNMSSDTKMERGLISYQNAIKTLDNAAYNYTNIPSARSITLQDIVGIIGGISDEYKGDKYGIIYNYYYDLANDKVMSKYATGVVDGETTWSNPYKTTKAIQTFVDEKGNKVIVDSEDNGVKDEITLTHTGFNYSFTTEQEKKLEALLNTEYWIATKCLTCDDISAKYNMFILYNHCIATRNLFNSANIGNSNNYGVRCVILI